MSGTLGLALKARRRSLPLRGTEPRENVSLAARVVRPPDPLANSGAITEMRGGAGLLVAVIDGPYAAGALSGVLAEMPINLGAARCGVRPNSACDHGTFVIGLLGARRDALVPGLCPDCRLLHIPLFIDEHVPWASVGDLARAIADAVESGARLINLSLGIVGDDAKYDQDLAAALDYAEASGAIVIAAAGNQGRPAMGQLLSHPVTIPVVAVDAAHQLLRIAISGH
jgi:subtilisin family serine protease